MGNHLTFAAYTARRAANSIVAELNTTETLTPSLRQGAVQKIGALENLTAADQALYTDKVVALRVPLDELPRKVVQRTFVSKGDSPLYDRFMFASLSLRSPSAGQARTKRPNVTKTTAEALQLPRPIPTR
jgi:hypothetical protein